MPILSDETFLESGKLFKKNFQSRSLDTCCELDFRLNVKSKAQKVNCLPLQNWTLYFSYLKTSWLNYLKTTYWLAIS